MTEISELLPKPTERHLDLLIALSASIESHLQAGGHPRGLVVVQVLPTGEYRTGFTPAESLDVAHVMAMDVPEEGAIEVVQSVARYDHRAEAAVLTTERTGDGRARYSYVLLDVRPVSAQGVERRPSRGSSASSGFLTARKVGEA